MSFFFLLLIALACVPAIAGWSVFWALIALIATFWGAICFVAVCVAAVEVRRLRQNNTKL